MKMGKSIKITALDLLLAFFSMPYQEANAIDSNITPRTPPLQTYFYTQWV